MGERDEVLFANKEFYRAFAGADADRMAKIWAGDRDDVTVVHPGADAIAGRAGVLESWRTIFEGAGLVDVCCAGANAYIHGDVAIVLCSEIVQGQRLAATNIFRRTTDGWRLVHHHAGPCRSPQQASRPVLH
jgi:ketosteroid isomerase-like protein